VDNRAELLGFQSMMRIELKFNGIPHQVEVPRDSSLSALHDLACGKFDVEPELLKLLHKGARVKGDGPLDSHGIVDGSKLMVIGTSRAAVVAVQNSKSDPTIRGFESAERLEASRRTGNTDIKSLWSCTQHSEYRFCKFETCTRQSFGTRPTESTPHPYEAEKLLLKLATDPAIIDIMTRWEWAVLVLGEMDPIDDRLAKQKEAEGACLLGYNTNQGHRIDIRLRTDDLRTFRPYRQLVTTLLHELAHNLFGPHDDHFWACFAELFAEYVALRCRHLFWPISALVWRCLLAVTTWPAAGT